ncbi:hypothetical protein [Acidocella sp. MX-AZ03]|uniref:hypothetical protein n=1 Tax=Acidocella sp. MX-AZ03 TaxID=2697363 RepID=UPI003FA40AEB
MASNDTLETPVRKRTPLRLIILLVLVILALGMRRCSSICITAATARRPRPCR